MTFKEYSERIGKFAHYPGCDVIDYELNCYSNSKQTVRADYIYPVMGLAGEVGELSNIVKKFIRDKSGMVNAEGAEKVRDELGDVLWYVNEVAKQFGWSLSDIALFNIAKLEARYETEPAT